MTASALLAALALLAAASAAPAAPPPVIPDYGRIAPVDHPGGLPDPGLDYKVVVNVTRAGADGAPPPELEKAAKLANLLAVSGVPAGHRHIVAIIQGPATMAILNPAGMAARGKGVNASADLVAKMNAAGIEVHVCGQAMAMANIAPDEVMPGIQVDLSALTTLTTLELKGYVLLSD